MLFATAALAAPKQECAVAEVYKRQGGVRIADSAVMLVNGAAVKARDLAAHRVREIKAGAAIGPRIDQIVDAAGAYPPAGVEGGRYLRVAVRPVSVSYTHLDVYKRQAHIC